jgi:dihydroorotate dehydrogenase (NAD+) catalytic subunit
MNLGVALGPLSLTTPLVAASGTVGSIVDFTNSVDFGLYGAAVAKSVSPEPWEGRPPPRIGPAGGGMLNGIGIQNPGIDAWLDMYADAIADVPTQVWGSVVAHDEEGFAVVASKMSSTSITAVEVNLSCPNLDGLPFALDPAQSAAVVRRVRAETSLPIGAKLSPDATPIADVASAVADAGAAWVVVANTAMGAAIDPHTRRPILSGVVGGYSGEAIRPLTMRCVLEVAAALPDLPIVACGGVSHADHVIEYVLAGASAVGIGTAHLAKPRIAANIMKGLTRYGAKHNVEDLKSLTGAFEPWQEES